MEKPSPLPAASNQLKSSRIHSTVSSPGGVQHLRSSSRSPPPPTKPRSESHDRSFANARRPYERSRSQERDERSRPREFLSTERRRPPRNGPIAHPNRNGQDGSQPSEMGFQESPRLKFPERFQPRDRFRPPENLKNSSVMIDHSGQQSAAPRYFGASSAPSNSSIPHPRDFSPPTNYKNSINEPNGGRSADSYSGASPNMGPSIGPGLGSARYGDREDWRGRVNQFPREFERDRDYRNRDIRQDIRDIRDSRPPRDPRDTRDPRDVPSRERELRDRDMLYQRDSDYRDRDPRDRDLRELGITTRELRDRDNRDRDPRERGSWSSDKGREAFSGREVPDLDVRELVERERERERDRNRERPIWLRDLEKDFDGNIPTRPALDHINRERDRERERSSNSRPMTRVQELDRDLLTYASDKPRQTFGKTEETPHGADRGTLKPASLPNSSFLNTQRELKSHDGDDIRDRDRTRDRDRFHSKEDERESFSRESVADRNQQRDRERDFYNRPDGAGLRSDVDSRQRNTVINKRPRILSAPTLEDISYREPSGPQSRELHDRSSYPNSPATAVGPFSGRIEKNEKQDDRRQDQRPEPLLDPLAMNVDSYANRDLQTEARSVQDPGPHGDISTDDSRRLITHPDRSDDALANEPIPGLFLATGSDFRSEKVMERNQPEKDASKSLQAVDSSTIPVDHVNTSDINGGTDTDVTDDAPKRATILQEMLAIVTNPLEQEESAPSKSLDDSTSANDAVVSKDSNTAKAAKSPSMTSLPSPGLSPVQEVAAINTSREAAEFESHDDILEKIDTIDVKIQRVEDRLMKYRQQKEQPKGETQLTSLLDPGEDEDVAIDIEQPDTERGAEDIAVETVDKFTLASAVSAQDDLKSEDSLMNVRDLPSPVDLVPDRDMEDPRLEVTECEDVDMTASDAEVGKDRRCQIIQQFSRQELQNAIDEDDPFYKRKAQQKRRPQLYDQIYAENNTRAKKYGRVHSAIGPSREHGHHQNEQAKPQIYESVEDYPFYQENIESHMRLRDAMLHNMATKAAALDEKELELKREYKQHWESWIKKVEKLDKIKEKMSNAPLPANVREEDLVQSDNVLFTTRNRRGTYNSDAVRSEAELMEIIQSLENADMRNPDLRASRTAATVPPMILDPYVREKVHYFDRNHLVTDPAKYYRLGPVTDIWTEEEREIFIKRYLNYPKQFGKIAAGIENKTASQCVLFYYREKKKIGFKDMVSNRGRKRKPAANKRKEKAVQQPSPSGQPGKKHKGSALIEDIGQANRKMAKNKEVRELHDLQNNWADFDTKRRVRGSVTSLQSGISNFDESNSNVASPALSAVSTPASAAGERRKQRSKATNTRSSTAAASNIKALTEDAVVEGKKPKTEKAPPASAVVAAASSKTASKGGEAVTAVESPKVNPVSTSKQTQVSASETVEASVTAAGATPAVSTGGVARWTPAERDTFIVAFKKYGRDFEAVANAVGTKTVEQCKNYRFNYKRRYGVSALDGTSNQEAGGLGDGGEDKEISNIGVEKNKAKKGKGPNSIVISTPNTPQSTAANANRDTPTTPSGRRKAVKPPAQEAVKDDLPKEPPIQANSIEEPEAVADKKRKKRAVSKSDAGSTPTEPMPTPSATSFRARYSRDPSEASSPSIPAVSQVEDQFPSQANVDGSARRTNFSSYWSRQERIDFSRLLSLHGKNWDKISNALKTKTLTQVRNYYEKLAVDGIIGIDRSGSSPPPYKENEETSVEDKGVQQTDEDGHTDQDIDERDDEQGPAAYTPSEGTGPKAGYFMPQYHDDKVESNQEESGRAATPPRRITNIGNLLNNDDEDVNVAVEDWFGNNEEGSNTQSPEHPYEADGPPVRVQDSTLSQRYANDHSRMGDEDMEMEDEYEPVHGTHGIYGSSATGVQTTSHRHVSDTGISYSSSAPTPSYYNQAHHHPHSSQLPPGHTMSGTLGSPYDSQQYYRGNPHTSSGYRSPPPLSPTPGPHSHQRMKSPSISIPSGPSSAVMQPSHYPPAHVSHHSQHQRSSSIGHVDIISRSNVSPQPGVRERSPMSHQGSYFSLPQSHGYAQSPSHVQYGYAQSHGSHHSGPIEVIPSHPRHIRESSMTLQHPSSASGASHSHGYSQGHGHSHSLSQSHSSHSHSLSQSHSNHSHSHGQGHSFGHSHSGSVSRFSGSPQLPGSGSMRGSPAPVGPSARAGSPAHLGHGGHLPSRYSPIPTSSVPSGPSMSGLVGPVTSPRMSEPPVHHYQQHLRRSSSPFQHHISGQIPPPSYLQPPPSVMHSSSASKHQPSSSFGYGPPTPTSVLPPPLQPSSIAVSPAYHPGHQQQPSYSHSHHPTSSYGTPPPPHHHQQQSSHHHHPQ